MAQPEQLLGLYLDFGSPPPAATSPGLVSSVPSLPLFGSSLFALVVAAEPSSLREGGRGWLEVVLAAQDFHLYIAETG